MILLTVRGRYKCGSTEKDDGRWSYDGEICWKHLFQVQDAIFGGLMVLVMDYKYIVVL
jgi:hypothetical protein